LKTNKPILLQIGTINGEGGVWNGQVWGSGS